MIRMVDPTSTVVTRRSRPRRDLPTEVQRSSSTECSASSTDLASGSSRASIASRKSTPCLRVFAASFSSSHLIRGIATPNARFRLGQPQEGEGEGLGALDGAAEGAADGAADAAGLAVGFGNLNDGFGVGTGVSPGVALAEADGPALAEADGAVDGDAGAEALALWAGIAFVMSPLGPPSTP